MPFAIACSICNKGFKGNDAIFSTWGVWLNETDPLYNFCDSCMHWDCYANWQHRTHFAHSYVDFWVKNIEADPIWLKAYLDDTVFVNVNPDPLINSAWICLFDTGVRINVNLNDWDNWLNTCVDKTPHPLLANNLAQAVDVLRRELPNADEVLNHINTPENRLKRELAVEEWARFKRERKIQSQIKQKQAKDRKEACIALIAKINSIGMRCPHCSEKSNKYEYSKRRHKKSGIMCPKCRGMINTADVNLDT